MQNIDEVITAYGQMTDNIAETRNARAELAMLRADATKAKEEWLKRGGVIDNLRATITEQARRLDEAQRLVKRAKDIYIDLTRDGYDYYDDAEMCDTWLAENRETIAPNTAV